MRDNTCGGYNFESMSKILNFAFLQMSYVPNINPVSRAGTAIRHEILKFTRLFLGYLTWFRHTPPHFPPSGHHLPYRGAPHALWCGGDYKLESAHH